MIAEVEAGETVPVVAARIGVGVSAAYLWIKEAREASKPTFARLVPASTTAGTSSSLMLEIGRARVHIEAGFDAALLRQVMSALSES